MELWNLIPQSIEPLVELFRRPKGYYEPQVLLPIDLNRTGASFSTVFRHRYRGPFQLGLRLESDTLPPERIGDRGVKTFDWGGRFRVTLETAGGKRMVRDVGEDPQLSIRDWRIREFRFFEYFVPLDLPFRSEIRLELQVLDAGRGLPARYGAAQLYLRRRSYYLYRRPR